MKSILKITLAIVFAATTLWSCKKDETKTVVAIAAKPTLTASSTTLNLIQANASNAAETFTWTAADLGYKAPLSYTLQLSKAGSNFSAATTTEISTGGTRTKSFTVSEINKELLKIVPASLTSTVEARIKTVPGTDSLVVYSNVVTLTVSTYRDIINYEFPQALRIAGSFQGWDPASAPKIVDKAASGTTGSNYEGYINFTDANPLFKMVKGNDWSAGDFGMASSTTLSIGGNNLSLSNGPGVFLLKANTSNMTWSATKINTWGIIGTFNAWSNSVPMSFNATTGKWTVTVDFSSANTEFKFRANDDWAINFGDGDSGANPPVLPDNVPDYGKDNIKVAVPGNYTITLDLGTGGNYSYTIKKN
jgi:starch-binding outer membrane protein SusE/F